MAQQERGQYMTSFTILSSVIGCVSLSVFLTCRSVSGKKLCSSCGQPLGKGAAMIIETLSLYFHIQCFKVGGRDRTRPPTSVQSVLFVFFLHLMIYYEHELYLSSEV